MKYLLSMLFLVLLFSCKRIEAPKANFLKDHIEINLHDRVDPKLIAANFEKFGLVFICQKNVADNICVYRFDTKSTSKKELIRFMGYEVGVESAAETMGCPVM